MSTISQKRSIGTVDSASKYPGKMTSNVYHSRISICFAFSEAQLRELCLHDVPSNLGQRRPYWLRYR